MESGSCRACSRTENFRRFSLYAVAEATQEVIAMMILETSNIQVSTADGLPQHICSDCLIALSLAYSFRQQCHRADAKFRGIHGRVSHLTVVGEQQSHQLPENRSSHTQNTDTFEIIIPKEEVDPDDHHHGYNEYNSSSNHASQWANPNTHQSVGGGAMTVVHNVSEPYFGGAFAGRISEPSDADDSNLVQPMKVTPEMAEFTALGQNTLKQESLSSEESPKGRKRQLTKKQNTKTSQQEKGQHNPKDGPKTWSAETMDSALEAIKNGMSYYKASCSFEIPIATLYWTAQRQGVKSQQAEFNKSYKEQQLPTALEAIKAGLSVTKASTKFNIPPSTLRRHIGYHGIKINSPEPTWTEEQMSEAFEAIQGGMNWKSASMKYNIPYATLIKRGKRCGISYPDQKKPHEQMSEALKAIQDGMSYRKARTVFNIPHGTLYQHARASGINHPKATATNAKNDNTDKSMGMALEASPSSSNEGHEHSVDASESSSSHHTTSDVKIKIEKDVDETNSS